MRKAGAKEDSEGSIGTEGAVDVNRSPFSTALTGRHSDSMIGLCSCTARSSSSSSLRNLSNTYISMTCKGCGGGGESTTDGGPSCSSKLNTMGLELPRPIDPEVRWKTVNRRQRAARRARTSFSVEDRMMGEMRSFYAFGSVSSLEMAQVDAPVSESEKLGVSILGRRFCDPMENVPIKKRRFHMDCSPSPPSTPLLVDPFEKILSRSCGDISGKRRKVKMLGCENREGKKGPFDADDFSGISILAAAACESEMDGDIFNGECSKSAHSLEERKPDNASGHSEFSLVHEIKEDKLNIQDASHCKSDMPLGSSESAPDLKPLFPTALSSSENLVESALAPKENHALFSSLSNANKTDDSLSASDAKSSGVTMPNNSSNPDKSVGCLQDIAVQTKCSNGTRDSRLHWDLNVAMEAWDTNCGDGDDDMVGPHPVASAVRDCNDAVNKMNKPQSCQYLFDPTVSGDIPDLSGDKIDVVDAPRDVRTTGENDFPGDSPSHPLCSQPHQNLQLLESESLDGNDSSAETKDLLEQQKGNYVCKVESHLDSNPDCSVLAPIAEHVALTEDAEKHLDVSHASPLDFEGLSHSASADGHGEGNSIQTSELGSHVKPLASRLVSEESTNLATHTVFNKNFTDLDNKHRQASQQSISEFKNQELLDVDSETSKIDQSVNNKAEHATYLLGLPKGAEDPDNDLDLPDPHPVNNPGSSDCEVARGHERDGVSATKNCVITCANSSSAETYYIASNVPQAPGPNSKCTKSVATDMDIIVDSPSAVQSYPNGYRNEIGKVASNNCLENCYETDASHISKDLAGTRKVDVEEDDSQYEDGELRESGDRYWADDGYEVKCVNYQVSDYKDKERAIDIPPLPAGSISKNMGIMGIPVSGYNETQSRKEEGDISPISLKRSWSTNCLDDGSGMVIAGSAGEKAHSVHLRVKGENQMYETNSGCIISGSVATVSQSDRGNHGLGDNLLSMRTKSTGWDMLPEDQRHPRHDSRDRVDSSNRCALSTLDAAGGGEPLRQMGLSNRDVQPPVDRPKSFDRPHRSELCRSDDDYGSGSKAEWTVDSHRLQGRVGASRHIQASNRGEQWVENSNHSRSTRHRSPDYYNYGPSGPRNAAEAAVAKMESNGFVVARDGTLVRAADAANAGSAGRRMRNTLSGSYRPLSGRGSPIDRDGACGLSRGPAHAREVSPERHFGATGSRSGRYGPEMDKDRTSDANMSSIRCSLSSRQRRFPPNRASLNLSCAHSRSRSGSRSRSPHAWTSPRNRRDIMANGGASLRRHSRSPPNYMTEVRIGRITSPQRQPGFDDRAIRYSPSSRNRTYSQHASTWVDGRNCSTDLSDNKKRYSRRSPPLRIPSRNDRFDVMDSHGRPRSGELYRVTQRRLPYGFERGRGNKHDGNGDDQREYAERYETHSVVPYDRNGSVKQFGNHTGDKLRPRISAPRSPEHQRRGSPRRFDRGFDRQLDADLPHGTKEDNKNPFRYD